VPGLTRALVERHALGRADAYDAALLDVAQDHLLYFLAELGCFDSGQLVFKGGTSLRKCRLGNDGRFSTDLDFAAPDEDVVIETCRLIDGARVGGFTFGLEADRGDGRHWRLRAGHEDLGRDLYDLNHFAGRRLDERLVRRLWVLKVWGDVVDDGRGDRPLEPHDVLRERRPQDFMLDSLGVLTRPVEVERWEARVRERFQFLAELDEDEQRWATCDERHRPEIDAAFASLPNRDE
jgi:predicted nucleotidyltransferase component of viral defense system